MDKNKAMEKRLREDRAINRVLIWFGGAVVFELYVLLIDRLYVHYNAGWSQLAYQFGRMLFVLGFVFAALAVGCAVWLFLRRRAGGAILLPAVGLVSTGAMAAASFIARHWYGKGVQTLIAGGIMVAVLAMIYYLYQREFFVIAALMVGALFGMWLFRAVANQRVLVFVAFAALGVLAVGAALAAYLLQKSGGSLTVGGKKYRIIAKRGAYPLIYATCAVAVAALVVPLLFGAAAAYYTMFVLAAWLFVMAVYFTIKMM